MKTLSNTIFRVTIEGLAWPEIKRRLQAQMPSPFWIVTVNPEILLAARFDPSYAQVLMQADSRTVDGIGLWLILRAKGVRATRMTGVALAEHLLVYAEEHGLRVALYGGLPGVAARAMEVLQKNFPTVPFIAEQGGVVAADGSMDETGEEAGARLTLFAPHILFVALSYPRQERWLARQLHQFPTVQVAVGTGGTIDFWAGRIARAPSWMQRLGLEWAWRLLQEPKRIGRIFRAVVIFPLRALQESWFGR